MPLAAQSPDTVHNYDSMRLVHFFPHFRGVGLSRSVLVSGGPWLRFGRRLIEGATRVRPTETRSDSVGRGGVGNARLKLLSAAQAWATAQASQIVSAARARWCAPHAIGASSASWRLC